MVKDDPCPGPAYPQDEDTDCCANAAEGYRCEADCRTIVERDLASRKAAKNR